MFWQFGVRGLEMRAASVDIDRKNELHLTNAIVLSTAVRVAWDLFEMGGNRRNITRAASNNDAAPSKNKRTPRAIIRKPASLVISLCPPLLVSLEPFQGRL